jgi:integrase/recombinase XerD
MIEDMTIRKFAPKTQHDYVQRIKNFTAFLGRSPDTASFEDVRRYQLHLTTQGVGVPTLNQTVATLRFFFRVTLKRHDIVEHTTFIHEPRKLPMVLSPEEVARLLNAAPGLKYKAALSVAYGAGLRAAEVVSLKVCDIDSRRMIIRVEQGKGRKDRNVMLSASLLELLRTWWRAARPQGWLFPGRDRVQPITTRQLNRACHAAAQMAEIDKRVSLHTLRHSFATHLLEQNVDVRVIQVLLGHAKLDTTALYTRVATKTIQQVMSPLEHIALKLKEMRSPTSSATRVASGFGGRG